MKPILSPKVGDSVQHPSGLLSKQISREQLVKDFAVYVHTHSHLYENAEDLKQYLAMSKGKVANALGKNVRVTMAQIGGVNTPVFAPAAAKENRAAKEALVQDILKKREEQIKLGGNTPPNQAGKKSKK